MLNVKTKMLAFKKRLVASLWLVGILWGLLITHNFWSAVATSCLLILRDDDLHFIV